MKGGEIWTLQDRHYASKARPVVVIQSDRDDSFGLLILCLFASFGSEDKSTRVRIGPSAENGLQKVSYVMVDKIVTVDKNMLGKHVGMLSEEDIVAVSEQLK